MGARPTAGRVRDPSTITGARPSAAGGERAAPPAAGGERAGRPAPGAERAAPSAAGALDMSGLLVGAAGMFATMYSTQAILPRLGEDFEVSPSQTGLTISVVVLAVAAAGWAWGLASDRYGRK